MSDKTFPVYIPAGSDPSSEDNPLLQKAGVKNKALIRLNGKQLIDYVLEAADNAERIERIYLVGLTEDEIEYNLHTPITFIPSKGSRMETLKNLMSYIEDEYEGSLPRHLLTFSADIPLITSQMIDNEIHHLETEYGERFSEIELFYALIPKDIVLNQYPDANKRFRKFKEGRFATGDFLIFSPHILRNEKTMEAVQKMMESRKQIIRLLIKFDWLAPLKYIFGKLSARNDIFPFLKDHFDVTVDMMVSENPEIGLDLDYPEDLEKFEKLVEDKQS